MSGTRHSFHNDDENSWQWLGQLARVVSGQPLQRFLAEVETALLALPSKELISGAVADEDGVCALGAVLATRKSRQAGLPLSIAVAALVAAFHPDDYDDQSLAAALNITPTLAFVLVEENDLRPYQEPSARYERMLQWVRTVRHNPKSLLAEYQP